MFKDSDFKRNLLVSIITSVLVLLFIEPAIKWTGNAVMWLGINAYEGFTNSVYSSAALGLREKYSFMLHLMFLSLLVGAASGVAFALISRTSNKVDDASRIRMNRWRKILVIVFSSVLVLDALVLIGRNYAEMQLISSFNQRITVLAARASDQQIKDLRAGWAAMQKRSDYESLTAAMDRLAKDYNIRLPDALWN